MLHGLRYGVLDMGIDPSVRPVEARIVGHGDIVQNLNTYTRTHHFICGSLGIIASINVEHSGDGHKSVQRVSPLCFIEKTNMISLMRVSWVDRHTMRDVLASWRRLKKSWILGVWKWTPLAIWWTKRRGMAVFLWTRLLLFKTSNSFS